MLMTFGESFGQISQLMVPSPRNDLIDSYIKRGYKEIKRFPLEDFFLPEYLLETGHQMILMQKNNEN